MQNYLFGQGTPWTYDELQAKREIAKELMRQGGTPRNVGEGLNALGKGIAAGILNNRAAKRESALRDEFNSDWDSFFSGFDGLGGFGGGASSGAGYSGDFGGSGASSGGGAEPWADADNPTLAMLREFEGFRDKPYWDVNALRAGYGSDTVTMPDGSIVPVGAGTTVDREAAERDLMRRVSTEFEPAVVKAVGQDVFARLSPQQRAALTSLSYNYGAGAWSDDLSDVAAAARSGDAGAVAAAINALGGHNDGINRRRREREAAAFLSDAAPGMTTGTGLAEAVMPPMDGGAAPVASAKGQPLGMIGGVRGDGGYWQSFDGDGLAHAANPGYTDYSQLFRDYTFEQKPGYVPVGERDGQTVYAAPDYLRGEDGNYMPVSAADVQRLAAERDGLVPTRDEVAALYDVATQIPMPTQPIGETGGPGDPAAYTAAVTQALGGQAPTGPIAHGKEFFAPGMGGQPPAAPQAVPAAPQAAPMGQPAPMPTPPPTPAQYAPQGGGGASRSDMQTIMQLARFASNPMASPGQKMVAQALLQQTMAQMQPQEPDWKWIDGMGMVDMNSPPPELMAGQYERPQEAPKVVDINGVSAIFNPETGQYEPVQGFEDIGGGRDVGVRASQILPDGTVVQSTDQGVRVFNVMGEELTGQAAADAVKAANAYGVDLENQTYFNRRGGTLGADIEMGGEAAAAIKAGENAQAAGMQAWEAIPQARASIPKLERVIELLDAGADVGMIASQLPALNDATRELRNMQNQLGLDVIGSVTFGALSEGELRLALSTALPDNMGKEALKDWVRRKMAAQEKLATYMEEQARFLLQPGNTLAGWMDYVAANKQSAPPSDMTAPPPGGGLTAPVMPGGGLPPPPPGIDPEIWPQVWEKLSPADQELLSQ